MAQQHTDIAKDSRLAEVKAGPAQTRYAATLAHGAVLSFAVMLVTYVLYVSGITEPLVPLEEMPKLWVHSAAEYRAAAHIPEGGGWLRLLSKGDMANFIGLALLASVTVVCYAQLTWSYLRSRRKLEAAIALLEILVLLAAASGLLV